MNNLKKNFILIVAAMLVCTGAYAEEYGLDNVHTYIGFNVAHLIVAKTAGEFKDYTGSITYDPKNVGATKINVVIQSASIDTNNEDRDGHLRSPDFFDAAKYPTITFTSTEIKKSGDKYVIVGDLTMHGVTRSISLTATIAGPIQSPFGFKAIGISAEGTINRQDFGVSWNKTLDQGGYMVGNEVELVINVEAHSK